MFSPNFSFRFVYSKYARFNFLSAALAFLVCLAASKTTIAATFTVSNAGDSGSGSLRQAILDANNTPGDDEIVFSSFFDSQRTITLLGGNLEITSGLTISGKGANLLTISGNNQSRAFHVHTATTPVILSGMTITAGKADAGAGIWSGVNLTLNGVVVHDNDATITPAQGGGIFNNGTLTLNNSTVSSNYANDGCTGFNTSCATRNSGAGIYNNGTLNVTNSTVNSNWATNRGGGIYNSGSTTVTNSTISDNTVSFEGFDRVGGGIYTTSSLTITNSTISNNRAFNGSGGISIDTINSSLPTRITNSTLVGNNTENNGGAITVGGCLNYNVNQCGALELTNSTVTGNFSNSTAAGEGGGGGIYCVSPHCRLNNSIVAGNSFASGTRHDVYAAYRNYSSNAAFSGSYNLIGKGDGIYGLSNGTNNNQIGSNSSPIDPRFAGGLQFNGGPTRTIALRSESPAIDKGNATGTDQRGAQRPFDYDSKPNSGNGADIGALESGTFIVNSLLDAADNSAGDGLCGDGLNCTLRAAIQEANAAGEAKINFEIPSGGMQTIQLASPLPVLSGKIIIAGPGADKLTVRRNSSAPFRIFNTSNQITISGMTITGGNAESRGGGIYNLPNGNLMLDGVVITGNRVYALANSNSWGAGICNESSLTAKNSTVSGNVAEGGNGGSGGGIVNFSSNGVTLVNSTVSGNSAQLGAGIFNYSNAVISLTNSTVAFNAASDVGGGILSEGGATLNLKNTIVAGNTALNAPDISGGITSQGYNLIQNRQWSWGLNATTDLPNGTNPRLNPALALNGGTTLTHALLPNSPAIDKGSAASGVTEDQRGVNRIDFPQIPNNQGGNGFDIGAFEFAEFWNTLTVTKTADTNDNSCTAADCSLREAVAAANATTQPEQINFVIPANDPGCNAATGVCAITLTLGEEIVVNGAGGELAINGTSANALIVNAGDGFARPRIFYSDGARLTVENIRLINGSASEGGAIYVNGGTLVLRGAEISGNNASSRGGGVYFNGGTNHQILDSTFFGNMSFRTCGGFDNNGGTLSVTNSTISGNRSTFYLGGTGGGFCNSGTATLRNATVTSNAASIGGGGIYNHNGTLNLGNTIVAGNRSGHTPYDLSNGAITTAGNNLIGSNNAVGSQFPAGNPNANNDRVGTSAAPLSARLAPLGNYGGTTPTHALLSNSPAIDNGNSALAATPTTDQRGAGRGGAFDIGAFELDNSFTAVALAGRRGQGYNLTLAPDNNGLTYSVTAGSLPPGLSLTAALASLFENPQNKSGNANAAPSATVAITGTPLQAGTYKFTVTASDGTNSIETNYQIVIDALAPTAAQVQVGGRVLTPDGRGIRNVLVTMTDESGQTRAVLSGAFGHYRFADVHVGATYIFSVSAKKFSFNNPVQVRSIQEETDDINFIADN